MPLRYEKTEGIATITIDNPPVNAFTPALHKDFAGILSDFLSDRTIRVGILTASGERAFCAGDDIKSRRPERTTGEIIDRHFFPRKDAASPEYPGYEAEVMKLCEERFKPIIAAVNGPVMGQGLVYLVQLTDIRIATPNSRFGLPEIAYGMGGSSGAMQLGRHIPPTAALWLALTGHAFSSEQALHSHLINEIVAPDRLQDRAIEIAQIIAQHPALAVRTEMEAFYASQDLTRNQARAFTAHLYRLQRAAMDQSMPLAGGAHSTRTV
jgi:enoyl-CoA hydratase/carnithine racemase